MSALESRSEWNDTCKFLRSVNMSLVQVCLPKSIGQNGMMLKIPGKCGQITCTSMSAYEHYSERNDICRSCQL